jgi:hypothetical protein
MASIDRGALVTKGSWFFADEGFRQQDGMIFRATFAAAPEGQIDLAIQRFGAALRDVFGLQSAGAVEAPGLGCGVQDSSAEAPSRNGVHEASGLVASAENGEPSGQVSTQNGFHQASQNGVHPGGHA